MLFAFFRLSTCLPGLVFAVRVAWRVDILHHQLGRQTSSYQLHFLPFGEFWNKKDWILGSHQVNFSFQNFHLMLFDSICLFNYSALLLLNFLSRLKQNFKFVQKITSVQIKMKTCETDLKILARNYIMSQCVCVFFNTFFRIEIFFCFKTKMFFFCFLNENVIVSDLGFKDNSMMIWQQPYCLVRQKPKKKFLQQQKKNFKQSQQTLMLYIHR